jgi:hypothetical protein
VVVAPTVRLEGADGLIDTCVTPVFWFVMDGASPPQAMAIAANTMTAARRRARTIGR